MRGLSGEFIYATAPRGARFSVIVAIADPIGVHCDTMENFQRDKHAAVLVVDDEPEMACTADSDLRVCWAWCARLRDASLLTPRPIRAPLRAGS